MTSFAGYQFTREFGLDVLIMQGPIGGVGGPEVVAVVENAGGLGILPVWMERPDLVACGIEETRNLTARPFGVNPCADIVPGGPRSRGSRHGGVDLSSALGVPRRRWRPSAQRERR